MRAFPAHPDRCATAAGGGRLLVPALCCSLSAADRNHGGAYGRAHGYGGSGACGNVGYDAGELSPDRRSKRDAGFLTGQATGRLGRTGFSLSAFDFAGRKPDRLKPVLLKSWKRPEQSRTIPAAPP